MGCCEGFPRQATRLAVIATLAVLASGANDVAAGDSGSFEKRAGGHIIAAPREILPWRRAIEARADRALERARAALVRGDATTGEARLKDVVRDYPETYAGRTAKNELDQRRNVSLWGGDRRRGLGVSGNVDSDDGDVVAISPVAGWQTVVRRDNAVDLRESLIESAGDRVFFQEGSAKLTEQAGRVLKRQAHWLNRHGGVELKIIGHADDEGSGTTNLRLSHDRAVAVRKRLIHEGVPGGRLHVLSVGNAQPIAICSVKSCAAQNRRVVSEIRDNRQAFGLAR